MDLRTYFRELGPEQQEQFARDAGTTVGYIRCHLVSDPPRKIPRRKLLEGFVRASDGALSLEGLAAYFYGAAPERASA